MIYGIRNERGELVFKSDVRPPDKRAIELPDDNEPVKPDVMWLIESDGRIDNYSPFYPFSEAAIPVDPGSDKGIEITARLQANAEKDAQRHAAWRRVVDRLTDEELLRSSR